MAARSGVRSIVSSLVRRLLSGDRMTTMTYHDLPRGCAQAQTAGRPSRVTSNPPATSKPVASVKLARKPRASSPTGKSAPQSATRAHQQLPDRRSPDPIRHKPPESCLLPTARLARFTSSCTLRTFEKSGHCWPYSVARRIQMGPWIVSGSTRSSFEFTSFDS